MDAAARYFWLYGAAAVVGGVCWTLNAFYPCPTLVFLLCAAVGLALYLIDVLIRILPQRHVSRSSRLFFHFV